VKAISQSHDELNLSLVIKREDLVDAINAIHDDLYDAFEG
jgi:aspartokinase